MTPADQGLSSLGLLMQYAGSMFAALVTMFSLVMLGDGARGWTLIICGLSITRSLVHRGAGKDLLYRATNRLGGIDLYVVVGLVHSVLVALIAWSQLNMSGVAAFGFGAGLAVWPLCLAVVFKQRRFRRFRDAMPLAVDRGFEGASILMLVLGISGIADTLMAAIVALALIDIIGSGMVIVLLFMLAVLVVRSILQVHAGLSGVRETTFDSTIQRAKRYADYSVTTTFGLCGALLLFHISLGGHVLGLAVIATFGWMLVAWPLIVRQFFADRQITDLIAGDDAPPHHRAPDAGLTNLGWLLLADAMMQTTFLLPELFGTPLLLHVAAGSFWMVLGIVVLQAWAGAELIRMSPQSRFIASAYGVFGTLVTLYANGPAIARLDHLTTLPSAQTTATFVLGFIASILPIATLILVNRDLAPKARARFRT